MPSIREIRNYISKEVEITRLLKLQNFFAAYVAKILLYTPITGNQVTFLMGVLAIIMGILFSFGKFWYSIIAVILLLLQINLDCIDGLIARYRNTVSIKGIFADMIVHSVTVPLIFFGLTLGVFKNTNNMWFLIFGISAAMFESLGASVQNIKHQVVIMKLKDYANGKNLDELKNKKIEKISTETGSGEKFIFLKKIVKEIFILLTYIHIMPFVFLFSIIFNFTHWVLVFYGIALPIKWIITVFYEWKIGYESLEYFFKPYQPK